VIDHLCNVFKGCAFLEGGLDLKFVLLEPEIIDLDCRPYMMVQ
jgi:hypothetical protein